VVEAPVVTSLVGASSSPTAPTTPVVNGELPTEFISDHHDGEHGAWLDNNPINAILVGMDSPIIATEVPTPLCCKSGQNAASPTSGAAMEALVQEGASELVLVPAVVHCFSSPTTVGLESFEEVPSIGCGAITSAPATYSTYCSSQHSRAAGSLFVFSPVTPTEYALDTNDIHHPCGRGVPGQNRRVPSSFRS
jgi:hypothetical protein